MGYNELYAQYTKPIGDPLVLYECMQLLDTLATNGVISRDPNNKDNILVYRAAGDADHPEGWYSQNLMSAADELMNDKEGQAYLMKVLADRNIPMVFENLLQTTDHLKNATFIKKEKAKNNNDIER